jgi:hypothetical protein
VASKNSKSKIDIGLEIKHSSIAVGDELDPGQYPQLWNLSTAFFYKLIVHPSEVKSPEFVYVPANLYNGNRYGSGAEIECAISKWNISWEAAQLRYGILSGELPDGLKWLEQFKGENIYLLPRNSAYYYYTFAPLFHLLPHWRLKHFGLPLLKRGIWPYVMPDFYLEKLLPSDFGLRLEHAFASHIWPLINSGSKLSAFSSYYPLKILAHNLDFWLPYAYQVIEDRLRSFDRTPIEDKRQVNILRKIQDELPSDIAANRPFKGGYVWAGEKDAWAATKEIVEQADANGKLRGIIDAVLSNSVEEDFSTKWSFAREDFERKMYKKRSKVKIRFVELDGTIPVHGPESEVHENLIWEDFLSLLNKKEREIVVLIRSGFTKVGEISKLLGYANHSPVSKALARIRQKAIEYLS